MTEENGNRDESPYVDPMTPELRRKSQDMLNSMMKKSIAELSGIFNTVIDLIATGNKEHLAHETWKAVGHKCGGIDDELLNRNIKTNMAVHLLVGVATRYLRENTESAVEAMHIVSVLNHEVMQKLERAHRRREEQRTHEVETIVAGLNDLVEGKKGFHVANSLEEALAYIKKRVEQAHGEEAPETSKH